MHLTLFGQVFGHCSPFTLTYKGHQHTGLCFLAVTYLVSGFLLFFLSYCVSTTSAVCLSMLTSLLGLHVSPRTSHLSWDLTSLLLLPLGPHVSPSPSPSPLGLTSFLPPPPWISHHVSDLTSRLRSYIAPQIYPSTETASHRKINK